MTTHLPHSWTKGTVIATIAIAVTVTLAGGGLWLSEHDAVKELEKDVGTLEGGMKLFGENVAKRLDESGNTMRVHMDTVHVYTKQELVRIRTTQDMMRHEQVSMGVDVAKITVAVESMQKSIEKIEKKVQNQ